MASRDYFQIVEKFRLSKEVARRIAQAIKEGRFLPGQSLPAERELAQVFNVSRPILREALHILEGQGLVLIQQGRRTTVIDSLQEDLDESLQEWISNNHQRMIESYEARLAIEPICAELATQRATPEQIDYLRELLANTEISVREKNIPKFTGQDIDFHKFIAKMSGNNRLYELLDALTTPETDVRQRALHLPGLLEHAQEGHLRIFSAIEARNPQAARQAMERALSLPIRIVQEYLEKKQEV